MKLWQRNVVLCAVAIALAALPLMLVHNAEWKGADDRGMLAIQELDANYQPWFGHWFDPASLGVERYMFGLQALLGAGVTFAAIGWFVGRRGSVSRSGPKGTILIAGLPVVLLGLLCVPNPSGTELQDLVTALQGVCLGFFAYLVGLRSGRRASRAPGATGPSAQP